MHSSSTSKLDAVRSLPWQEPPGFGSDLRPPHPRPAGSRFRSPFRSLEFSSRCRFFAAAIATAWPGVRATLLNLPTPLMIGLNFGRVFAVLFFLLALQGRLAGPFPFFAGWGDIITGVFAVPLFICCG